MKVSTITIAEYCVLGALDDLPLKNVQIVPFNLNAAEKTGEFARIIFSGNKNSLERLFPRAIIPNDSKLFAQCDVDGTVTHFVTSDVRSKDTYTLLRKETKPKFDIINIEVPYHQTFGILNL